MTSQLLVRVPTELKKKFKQTVDEQGLSMDYVINIFIRAYVADPKILQVSIDEGRLSKILKEI